MSKITFNPESIYTNSKANFILNRNLVYTFTRTVSALNNTIYGIQPTNEQYMSGITIDDLEPLSANHSLCANVYALDNNVNSLIYFAQRPFIPCSSVEDRDQKAKNPLAIYLTPISSSISSEMGRSISKRLLMNALKTRGIWNSIYTYLEQNNYLDDWNTATTLDENDALMQTAINALRSSGALSDDEEIENLLSVSTVSSSVDANDNYEWIFVFNDSVSSWEDVKEYSDGQHYLSAAELEGKGKWELIGSTSITDEKIANMFFDINQKIEKLSTGSIDLSDDLSDVISDLVFVDNKILSISRWHGEQTSVLLSSVLSNLNVAEVDPNADTVSVYLSPDRTILSAALTERVLLSAGYLCSEISVLDQRTATSANALCSAIDELSIKLSNEISSLSNDLSNAISCLSTGLSTAISGLSDEVVNGLSNEVLPKLDLLNALLTEEVATVDNMSAELSNAVLDLNFDDKNNLQVSRWRGEEKNIRLSDVLNNISAAICAEHDTVEVLVLSGGTQISAGLTERTKLSIDNLSVAISDEIVNRENDISGVSSVVDDVIETMHEYSDLLSLYVRRADLCGAIMPTLSDFTERAYDYTLSTLSTMTLTEMFKWNQALHRALISCCMLPEITLDRISRFYWSDGFVTTAEIDGLMTAADLESVSRDGAELKKVVFGNTVTGVADNAFANCTSLEVIEGGPAFQIVGASAFLNCSSLQTIPESITKIGSFGFSNCSNLSSVELTSDSTFEIPNSAFLGANVSEITFTQKGMEDVRGISGYAWNLQPGSAIHCSDGTIYL